MKSLVTLAATALLVSACSAAPADSPATARPPTPSAAPDPPPTAAPTAAISPSATPTPSTHPTSPLPTPVADPLLAVELTDVRSGETFTLAGLAATEGPVLLEPMAIWCSNCRAQQHEVTAAHELGQFTSVSLDVDLTERPEDLAAYADREGWDWRFAMADADLYRLLQERFGPAVTHPPSTPLIVIERDGTVRPLEFGIGIRAAAKLVEEIGG